MKQLSSPYSVSRRSDIPICAREETEAQREVAASNCAASKPWSLELRNFGLWEGACNACTS